VNDIQLWPIQHKLAEMAVGSGSLKAWSIAPRTGWPGNSGVPSRQAADNRGTDGVAVELRSWRFWIGTPRLGFVDETFNLRGDGFSAEYPAERVLPGLARNDLRVDDEINPVIPGVSFYAVRINGSAEPSGVASEMHGTGR